MQLVDCIIYSSLFNFRRFWNNCYATANFFWEFSFREYDDFRKFSSSTSTWIRLASSFWSHQSSAFIWPIKFRVSSWLIIALYFTLENGDRKFSNRKKLWLFSIKDFNFWRHTFFNPTVIIYVVLSMRTIVSSTLIFYFEDFQNLVISELDA